MNKALRRKNTPDKVVLVVLDGWGISPKREHNAIAIANKPHFESIEKQYGETQICASGTCVGLTQGQMGNSEVGHLTIGAGRIIFQDLMRVYDEINSGGLRRNAKLAASLRLAKTKQSTVHFMGLLSDGGVHSHMNHLFALLDIAKSYGINKIAVHAFLDGRDTPPKSGSTHIASLLKYLGSLQCGTLETISGRFYAMDRDNRWDRTKKAYDAIVFGKGETFTDPVQAIEQSYANGVTDEFVIPKVHEDYGGLSNGDVVLFFNFRPDRARQLTKALSFNRSEFGNKFDRDEQKRPKSIDMISMTVYDSGFKNVKALIGRERVPDTLSNVLEKNGIRQLRIAETEKYAHVTYFFNGLIEKRRKLEDRVLVPSVKVGTYDNSPEMSAREIASEAVKAMETGRYGFILINFANADMVGHSGNVPATVRAVETVDECLGKLFESWEKIAESTTMMITADHGNAEKMYDESTGQPHTAHTSNPVPLILVSKKWKLESQQKEDLGLKDIAPSILRIMGLQKPRTMTGQPFVTESK